VNALADAPLPQIGTIVAKRSRLSDLISERLSRLIFEGVLAPGTVIRTAHMAREMGVSRTPLREALQRMEVDGLVVTWANGSARVADYDRGEALEMMELREMIDGLAARILAQRGASAAVLAQLAEHVEAAYQASLADDKHGFLVVNADFHTAILAATNHRPLQQFHALVRITSQAVYMRLGRQPGRHRQSALEHREILAAIRDRDPAAAEAVARRHIRNAAGFWLSASEAPTPAPALAAPRKTRKTAAGGSAPAS
jgi:DNA-binding GntR family transcriptional regulator